MEGGYNRTRLGMDAFATPILLDPSQTPPPFRSRVVPGPFRLGPESQTRAAYTSRLRR